MAQAKATKARTLRVDGIEIRFIKMDPFAKKLGLLLARAYGEYLRAYPNAVPKARSYGFSEYEAYKYSFLMKLEEAVKEMKLEDFDMDEVEIARILEDYIVGYVKRDKYLYRFVAAGFISGYTIEIDKYKHMHRIIVRKSE